MKSDSRLSDLLFLAVASPLMVGPPALLPAQDSAGRYLFLAKLGGAYEWELRGHAPYPARGGFPCDEVVGRFCLHYREGKTPPWQGEGPELVQARWDLIEELRASVPELPHDTLVSGRLVRVLLDARDPPAAVEVALAFTVADTTDAWSYLFLGLALEADGQIQAAERAFAEALPRMAPSERRRMTGVRPLLSPEERGRYDGLGTADREAYLASLWRAGDPIYLTPGNETRAEHHARYVYARLLANWPTAAGFQGFDPMAAGVPPTWGEDLEELNRRFGVPVGSAERTCVYDGRVGRRPTASDRAMLRLALVSTR